MAAVSKPEPAIALNPDDGDFEVVQGKGDKILQNSKQE